MAEKDGIRSIADARRADGDETFSSEFWSRLAHAGDAAAFCATWLDIQCRAVERVVRGVVVLRGADAAAFADPRDRRRELLSARHRREGCARAALRRAAESHRGDFREESRCRGPCGAERLFQQRLRALSGWMEITAAGTGILPVHILRASPRKRSDGMDRAVRYGRLGTSVPAFRSGSSRRRWNGPAPRRGSLAPRCRSGDRRIPAGRRISNRRGMSGCGRIRGW